MPLKYNKRLVANARELRKTMTAEERHLWYDFLKRLPITVNRQKNIGNYIVDFYIFRDKLVIELDGKQHGRPESIESDVERDRYLNSIGIRVLRYKNDDIRNKFDSVCKDLLGRLNLRFEDLK